MNPGTASICHFCADIESKFLCNVGQMERGPVTGTSQLVHSVADLIPGLDPTTGLRRLVQVLNYGRGCRVGSE
ncbi:hypothetical protein AMTR_s00064p00087640 [Amborella trichopoda]|uniref:Uncharacterized protein n=1 Tax=Amborella trichopoda TaxID=13333 RepID=U5DEB0_AMBTC|nr:hypothetical protein AMTR_s00064p00087640 [Amborella trichopoda]